MPLGTERPGTFGPWNIRPVPSHVTDNSRIVAKRGNPDWFNNYVQPQLDTLQQQPVARIGKLFSDYLGDPTEPGNMNMAVGWIAPGLRRAIAEDKVLQLAIEAGKVRLPSKKLAYEEMMRGINKNPRVASHVENFRLGQPEYSVHGRFLMGGDKTAKSLKASRLAGPFDESKALDEIAKSFPEQVTNYRLAKSGGVPDYVPSHPDTNVRMESYYKRYPEDYKKAIDHYNKMMTSWENLKTGALRTVGDELKNYKPVPRGTLTLNEQTVPKGADQKSISNLGESYPITVRHELGHAATRLKDSPSALAYHDIKKETGYWLHPDEIKARAISYKKPVQDMMKEHYAPGMLEGARVEYPTYRKHDYMKRITKSIEDGMKRASPDERQLFWKQLKSGDIDLPRRYYDYLRNVEPADLMRINNWANPSYRNVAF